MTTDYLFFTELIFDDKNIMIVKSIGIWNHESFIAKLPRLTLGQPKNQQKKIPLLGSDLVTSEVSV